MADDELFMNMTSVGYAIDAVCISTPAAVRDAIYYEANSVLYLAFSAVASLVRVVQITIKPPTPATTTAPSPLTTNATHHHPRVPGVPPPLRSPAVRVSGQVRQLRRPCRVQPHGKLPAARDQPDRIRLAYPRAQGCPPHSIHRARVDSMYSEGRHSQGSDILSLKFSFDVSITSLPLACNTSCPPPHHHRTTRHSHPARDRVPSGPPHAQYMDARW